MQISLAPVGSSMLTLIPVLQIEKEWLVLKSDFLPTNQRIQDVLKDLSVGQHLQYYTDSRSIIYLSLGNNVTFDGVLKTFRKFFKTQAHLLYPDTGIVLDQYVDFEWPVSWLEALSNGIYWSDYTVKAREEHTKVLESVVIQCQNNQTYRDALDLGRAIALSQVRTAELVNAPSNIKTPQYLAEWALKSAETFGYQVKVMGKREILDEKLFALYEVGKASAFEPRFILAEYTPEHYTTTLGLVGKGITFDTGGISIKPSSNLHFMKCDMGGAAAVLGAMEAIAKLKPGIRVIAAVPCAENAIGGNAYRPGDIIQSHSGKTIEIIDTDAEGRLILADGISYLNSNYKPDVMIDLATLTGSSVATLGYEAAALFSDNNDLAKLIEDAGNTVGEKVWRLPLWDAYKGDLESDVADLRNYSGKPIAGAITAAKFLQAFTSEHPSWAHLDIAGVAFTETEFGKMKNATAYGVRLILQIVKQLAAQ